MLKKYCTTNQARIFTALILTGILSVSSGLTLIKNATAATANLPTQTTSELLKGKTKTNRLPRPVANAVLRDLARRERVSTKELKITNYSQQTWRNGCLELPQPDELCTQALVPGWRVVVSNGQRNWVYHTNNNGRSLRLAKTQTSSGNLPASVKNAVLQAASKRLQQPISRLNITQAQKRTWRDGCLELGGIDELCLAALTPGWRVIVGAVDRTLVYHTNQIGSVLRLNEKASESTDGSPIGDSSQVKPVPIPASELPPPLDQDVVFRQISSGGFAGRTYETVLLKDGGLIRVRIGDANDSERSVRRITVQEVGRFQRLLERSKFSNYKNLSYPAPNGAADYITYILTSRQGTVQYNDISQNNLPQSLQQVIKAWNQINSNAQT